MPVFEPTPVAGKFAAPTGPVNAASTGNTPAVQGISYVSLPTAADPGAKLGSATGVVGQSGSGTGVLGSSVSGYAGQFEGKVIATSSDGNTPAITGKNTAAPINIGGVYAAVGDGVSGVSTGGGNGVSGVSTDGNGISGASQQGNGVQGTSAGPNGSGLYGVHTGGSNGVYGTSVNGRAVVGISQPGIGGYFQGNGAGVGVWAESKNGDGLHAICHSSQANAVVVSNDAGGNAATFVGNVVCLNDHNVFGTINVSKDVVLTGADCAEEFDVESSVTVEAGTVMVVVEGAGLAPSAAAYDRKVAGVISGAGEYRPGLILDRKTSSEGRLPIALVGKVYCKVDAGHGAIEVGDLLTTSSTPGHAMKASDPSLAFGAVLGKALWSLKSGQGMIPILVALQ